MSKENFNGTSAENKFRKEQEEEKRLAEERRLMIQHAREESPKSQEEPEEIDLDLDEISDAE